MEHKVFEHLMLDLETMGNESNSAIISIGAIEFNMETGETGKEFFENIDLQSNIYAGLQMSPSTILWWMEQSKEVRNTFLLSDKKSLDIVLQLFTRFCNHIYEVWAKSPRFDCGILKDAYSKYYKHIPWDFRKERCVRTLEALRPDIKEQVVFKGTLHNPIDDCKYQIEYCSKIWNSLK